MVAQRFKCNQSREDYEARGVAEIRFRNTTSEAEGSGGEAAGFCRRADEVASFGDEVIANRLFRTRGLQGMWAAATRCLRERQARLNDAAANLKGLAMLARGSLGMWAAAGMLPTGRFATDKVVASATFHKEVCPCPMRSKVLACGFLRDRKRLVRKFLLFEVPWDDRFLRVRRFLL